MAEWLLGISATNPQQPLEMDLELESRRSRLLQRMETTVCTAPLEELAGDGMPDTAELDETTDRCLSHFLWWGERTVGGACVCVCVCVTYAPAIVTKGSRTALYTGLLYYYYCMCQKGISQISLVVSVDEESVIFLWIFFFQIQLPAYGPVTDADWQRLQKHLDGLSALMLEAAKHGRTYWTAEQRKVYAPYRNRSTSTVINFKMK